MASCAPSGIPVYVQQLDLATKKNEAPLRNSKPSAANACPLQSCLSPALNNPPIHMNSHRIGGGLFKPVHHAPHVGCPFSIQQLDLATDRRGHREAIQDLPPPTLARCNLLSPAFKNPPFHVNFHYMGSALFSSVLSRRQALNRCIMHPMWGALFSPATRPCYR